MNKRDWGATLTKMKSDKSEEPIKLDLSTHYPEVLLQRPLVKPLHGIAPREIMGAEWWETTRKQVYKDNGYHCLACGVHRSNAKYHKWMEAHEQYEVDYINTKYTLTSIISLCHCCHAFIHYQRTTAMLNCGNITKEKFDDIFAHGNEVLSRTGLVKSYDLPESHFPENDGTWSSWYLEFNGSKYFSKFANYQEWEDFYAKKNTEINK